MVMTVALFQSQENFAQDSLKVIFHQAAPKYCCDQMNCNIIGLHGLTLTHLLMGYLRL